MKNRIPAILIGFVVPLCAVTICFPIYNRIEPFILGFSFNYFWLFSWLFLTSLCLFIAYKIDPFNREDAKTLSDKKMEEVKKIIEQDPEEGLKSEVNK